MFLVQKKNKKKQPDRAKYEIKQNFSFYHERNLLIDKVTLLWWFTFNKQGLMPLRV